MTLEPNPHELNCCQNMLQGLTAHLSGKEHWENAKTYYQHALAGHHTSAANYMQWIDDDAVVMLPIWSEKVDDVENLNALVEMQKSSPTNPNAAYHRGLALASELASYLAPPVDHLWHSLRMLYDIKDAGGSFEEIKASISRVGPIHNVLDDSGIPVPGMLRERTSKEQPGWMSVELIEFKGGAFTVEGVESGPLVPLVTQTDLDIAAYLAFLESDQPVPPSFSLDRAPSERSDMRLDRKTFRPAWLAASSFGQSMYLADWLMKSFTMRDGLPSVENPLASGATSDDWNTPGLLKSIGDAQGTHTLPDGSHAAHGRLEIVVRSANVAHAKFRDSLLRQTHQYRVNDIEVFIESSLYGGNEDSQVSDHQCRDDPTTLPGARAAIITEHYDYVSSLFPVFERVRQILGLFSVFAQARRDGVVLSPSTQARLKKRVKVYKEAVRATHPQFELSPKPFHKGGCYCNGGVSGRTTAIVTETQSAAFSANPSSINWIVTPSGAASPVPDGAVKLTTRTGEGVRFGRGRGGRWGHAEHGRGEFNARTTDVYVMTGRGNNPPRTYFMNKSNQKVDPFTGRTIDPDHPLAHIYHDE